MLFKRNNSSKENKHRFNPFGIGAGSRSVPFHDAIAPYADGDGGEYIPRHMADIGVENGESSELQTHPDKTCFDETCSDKSRPNEARPNEALFAQPNFDVSSPDGSHFAGKHIAANGAVIREPMSEQPEILPDYEYTDEKEDLNLLIM